MLLWLLLLLLVLLPMLPVLLVLEAEWSSRSAGSRPVGGGGGSRGRGRFLGGGRGLEAGTFPRGLGRRGSPGVGTRRRRGGRRAERSRLGSGRGDEGAVVLSVLRGVETGGDGVAAGAVDGGAVETEAEDARDVDLRRLGRDSREAEGHEEEVGEGGAEIGAVDAVGRGGGAEDLATARAVEDDLLDADGVVEAERQGRIVVAVEARAAAKVAAGVLGVHGLETVRGDDVAGVDQPVELDRVRGEARRARGLRAGDRSARGARGRVALVRRPVEDDVEALAKVLDHALESVQVEPVLDVVPVDLAEELVAAGPAEARDPRRLLLLRRALHPTRACC
mmetsp:Transcript_18638/g.58626  ORF Transcript_18638/g.58626 Transcript_18638/m.58626 type:complete len:336 (-) Transcript_18638:301-1308(-)